MRMRWLAMALSFGFMACDLGSNGKSGGGTDTTVPQGVSGIATGYKYVVDLGALGGDSSWAWGINNKGQVVGEAETGTKDPSGSAYVVHAFIWNPGLDASGKPTSAITDLNVPTQAGSQAIAINDLGHVAGNLYVAGDSGSLPEHAFLWKDGNTADIGTNGGPYSVALAMNDLDEVVGYFAPGLKHAGGALYIEHPFLYKDGKLNDIYPSDTDHVTISMAASVNNQGQVVGSYYARYFMEEPKVYSFLYDGTWKTLDNPNGAYTQPYSINDKGQIVGKWADSTIMANSADVYLMKDGALKDEGKLGGIHAVANHINNNGQVVGWILADASHQQAFIWENGQSKKLNELIPSGTGWDLQVANSINDRGDIVGFGKNGDGKMRAFLLTNGLP